MTKQRKRKKPMAKDDASTKPVKKVDGLDTAPLQKVSIAGTTLADWKPKEVTSIDGIPFDEFERQFEAGKSSAYELTPEETKKAIEIETDRRDLKIIESGGTTPREKWAFAVGTTVMGLIGLAMWLKGCFS